MTAGHGSTYNLVACRDVRRSLGHGRKACDRVEDPRMQLSVRLLDFQVVIQPMQIVRMRRARDPVMDGRGARPWST
jgi:hypothetical protein